MADPTHMPRPAADLLIRADLVVTCVPTSGDAVGRIWDAAVAVQGERILAIGPVRDVETAVDVSGATALHAPAVAPGFVDSHTHLVFGGSRAVEYAARMTRTAAEVAALGIPTGILATVAMTHAASDEVLLASAAARLAEMFRCGTTTAEVKSGYGLTTTDELRMLEVARILGKTTPVDVVSTFLGAHDFPRDMPRERYVDLVVEEMIPAVAERGLADFCDVYCDEGYYTVAQTQRVLEAGLNAGLRPKIHVDAYANVGGAALAAALPVVSADHLNYTIPADAARLAGAGVIGVVMPALDWAVQHGRPFDARMLMAQRLPLALATDLCPACWTESMQLVMQFACRLYRFSPEEALLAATINGARALGLSDRGALAPGLLADLQIWDSPALEDIIYRLGHNAVSRVVKRGRLYNVAAPTFS
jgi:imidazolonepropionase